MNTRARDRASWSPLRRARYSCRTAERGTDPFLGYTHGARLLLEAADTGATLAADRRVSASCTPTTRHCGGVEQRPCRSVQPLLGGLGGLGGGLGGQCRWLLLSPRPSRSFATDRLRCSGAPARHALLERLGILGGQFRVSTQNLEPSTMVRPQGCPSLSRVAPRGNSG